MRPPIVIALLLVGLAGFGGILLLKKLITPAPPATISVAQPPAAPAAPQEFKPVAPQIPHAATNILPMAAVKPAAPVPPVAVRTADDPAKNEADIQAHIDRLETLQGNDDAESLQAILSELTNSDKTIRAAAVESTIQFGSRDAIPVLKDLAARTGDPVEKKQLVDAADFLALPTLTEIRAQNPNIKIIPPAGRP